VANISTNYKEFTLQQFLEDPFFREWVLRPDFESDQFWGDWISENPDRKEILTEAKSLLLELRIPEYSLSQDEVEVIWDKIQIQVKSKNKVLVAHAGKSMFWQRFAAAGIAAILVLGIWWSWSQTDLIEVKTAYGETMPLFLPDGSKLILNANSKVRYSEKWDPDERREIWLEGEAFFDVVHLQSHQPFLVYTTNGVEVEVLGTSFSVYDRDKKAQIVLEEGNVSLAFSNTKQPREKILMKPGDLVSIKEDKVEKKVVDAVIYTSWTQNLLILDQTSLEEIIRVGRENFGLEIKIDPRVSLNQTASGSMPLEDQEEFMNLTAKIFNVTIAKKESTYQITL
jgi:ferric-dicitrate binding protein FerR (iron transport regulator)